MEIKFDNDMKERHQSVTASVQFDVPYCPPFTHEAYGYTEEEAEANLKLELAEILAVMTSNITSVGFPNILEPNALVRLLYTIGEYNDKLGYTKLYFTDRVHQTDGTGIVTILDTNRSTGFNIDLKNGTLLINTSAGARVENSASIVGQWIPRISIDALGVVTFIDKSIVADMPDTMDLPMKLSTLLDFCADAKPMALDYLSDISTLVKRHYKQ